MIVKTKIINAINIKLPAEPSNARTFWKTFTMKFFAINIILSLSGIKLLKNSGRSDFILADRFFKDAYRAYKLSKLTSMKVTQINTQFIQ